MQYYCSNAADSNYNLPFPENDINTCSVISSKLQEPSSNNFLFSFPNSPHIHLEYEEPYNQFLQLLDQHKSMENQNPTADDNNPNHETAAGEEYQPPPPSRKRCCKKDRHSKINTARGPRDRRMRLSLEVARKFFDLQDLLGYDKASRTVDWLIKNSTAAIRRLERSNRGGGSGSFSMGATAHSGSVSASSDGCEAVSSPNHSTTTTAAAAGAAAVEPQQQPRAKPKKRKKIRSARATVERESRRRARERARERTSQKRRLLLDEIRNQPKISSKSLTESPMQASTELDDLNSETQINTVLYSATWNPSAIYQGNAGIVSHHIADEFDCGQAWEAAYNTTAFNVT